MAEDSWQEWFEHAWEVREEPLYRSVFGDLGQGIFPLSADLFTSVFPNVPVDPRWLHDVFECPPTEERKSWLYVSSGLSNAWDADHLNPPNVSGLGCEFVFQCTEQAQWAIGMMRRIMAFQIMLSVGRFPGKGLVEMWDRIPLRGPIDGASSKLTYLLLTPAVPYDGLHRLPSGEFMFIGLVGVSEDEIEYGRQNGGDRILEILLANGAAPVTDPHRCSVLVP